MLNCFFMIIIRVFKQDEFLELSRVASGTFGSVVKVSQQLLMVGGTDDARANIYPTVHWLFIVYVQENTFLIGVSRPVTD